MNKELENNFLDLEDKILRIGKEYKLLKHKYKSLSDEFSNLERRCEEIKEQNRRLLEEQKNMRLVSAISGNPEHNRLMKNYINRLMKEIDMCITQLQNDGM